MWRNVCVGTSRALCLCLWMNRYWTGENESRRHNDTRFRCLIDLSKITFITLTYERTEKIIKWSTHTSAHIIHLQSAFSICQCFYSFVSISCRSPPLPHFWTSLVLFFFFMFVSVFRKPKAWQVAHKRLAMFNSKLTKIISNQTRARWLGLRHNWEQQDVKIFFSFFEGHGYIYNAQQFGHDSKERKWAGRAGRALESEKRRKKVET